MERDLEYERKKAIRFWERVDIKEVDECWPWLGPVSKNGYGEGTLLYKKRIRSHRLAFFFANGRQPDGLILHSCDNPPCCNPAHLREGTHADNLNDRRARGRLGLTITQETVSKIRDLLNQGLSYGKIAKACLISPSTVRDIKKGRRWASS